MSDMIERVAKALCKRDVIAARLWWGQPHQEQSINDYVGLIGWKGYMSEACAAIEAMREPTAEMIDAGVRSEWGGTLGTRVANSYRDMIDAALSQDTHSLPLKPQEAVKPAGCTPHSAPAGTNSTRSALSVGSDGSPSTLSSEAGGAKMEGGSSASPDRAAKAGISYANSEQAVTNSEAE
jgi:hypothetical protein